MKIIPAIDILDGKCVRLNQGDYNKVTLFSSNPVKQALEWQKQGAEKIHLVDLDGARSGNPINDKAIKSIKEAVSVPIQIGGGIRTEARIKELLDIGIDKIILGTFAIEDPKTVREIAEMYPNRIILGIDTKNGKAAISGWTKESKLTAIEVVNHYANAPIASIITTDIRKDGTLLGPDLEGLKEMCRASSFPVIASGGIGSIADIISILPLEEEGIEGIILGRALYDQKINLTEAIKVTDGRKLNDGITNSKYLA